MTRMVTPAGELPQPPAGTFPPIPVPGNMAANHGFGGTPSLGMRGPACEARPVSAGA
jgi:hypothetical protein